MIRHSAEQAGSATAAQAILTRRLNLDPGFAHGLQYGLVGCHRQRI